MSTSHLTLDDVIQCEAMWIDFTEVVDKLHGKDLPVQKKEMDACTTMATALLTFRSWQWSCAIYKMVTISPPYSTSALHNSKRPTEDPMEPHCTCSVVPCRRNTTNKHQHTFQNPCKIPWPDSSHCDKCPEEGIHRDCLSPVEPRGSTAHSNNHTAQKQMHVFTRYSLSQLMKLLLT